MEEGVWNRRGAVKRKNCGRRSATEHKLTNTEFVEVLFAPKIDDICWSCTYMYIIWWRRKLPYPEGKLAFLKKKQAWKPLSRHLELKDWLRRFIIWIYACNIHIHIINSYIHTYADHMFVYLKFSVEGWPADCLPRVEWSRSTSWLFWLTTSW